MDSPFDIFRVEDGGSLLWRGSAASVDEAKARVLELARELRRPIHNHQPPERPQAFDRRHRRQHFERRAIASRDSAGGLSVTSGGLSLSSY